jgi:cytochrome c556
MRGVNGPVASLTRLESVLAMMSKLRKRLVVTSIVCLGCLLTGGIHAGDLKDFMRAKLTHSEKVLEGLTREDYQLIAKHSQAMSLLCQDAEWQVLKTAEYSERSREFRRSVDELTAAAKAKNLEAATLAYMDTTMKCVSCHTYVRRVGQQGK